MALFCRFLPKQEGFSYLSAIASPLCIHTAPLKLLDEEDVEPHPYVNKNNRGTIQSFLAPAEITLIHSCAHYKGSVKICTHPVLLDTPFASLFQTARFTRCCNSHMILLRHPFRERFVSVQFRAYKYHALISDIECTYTSSQHVSHQTYPSAPKYHNSMI